MNSLTMNLSSNTTNNSLTLNLSDSVCRYGNNDLVPSVRRSRINNTSDLSHSVESECNIGTIEQEHVQSGSEQHSAAGQGCLELYNIEEDVESRVLNNSNVFVPQDPAYGVQSDVHMSENMVINDGGEPTCYYVDDRFYQGPMYTESGYATNGVPCQFINRQENNDLKPSYRRRHTVQSQLGQTTSEHCSRAQESPSLAPNFVDYEDNRHNSSLNGTFSEHEKDMSPPSACTISTQNKCVSALSSNSNEQPRNRRNSLPLECNNLYLNRTFPVFSPNLSTTNCQNKCEPVSSCNVTETTRNGRISLPLECCTDLYINNRTSSVVEGMMYNQDKFVHATLCNSTEPPNNLRNSLLLESGSDISINNRTISDVDGMVDPFQAQVVTRPQLMPKSRRISLPLESITSTVASNSNSTYPMSVDPSDYRSSTLNYIENVPLVPLDMHHSKENSGQNVCNEAILTNICPSTVNGLLENHCDDLKPSDRSRQDQRGLKSTNKYCSNSVSKEQTKNENDNRICGNKVLNLKCKKDNNKFKTPNKLLGRNYSTKRLQPVKQVGSTKTGFKRLVKTPAKRKSCQPLRTPAKYRQLKMIQNVHQMIAKRTTDNLDQNSGDSDVLSKLDDIFPLVSVVDKSTRSLRASSLKDNPTLSRKPSTVGIWNAVNTDLLS